MRLKDTRQPVNVNQHTFKAVDGRTVPSEEALKLIVARYDKWVREDERREREESLKLFLKEQESKE